MQLLFLFYVTVCTMCSFCPQLLLHS